MKYSDRLIEMLAESYCPNDIGIEDCSKEYPCHPHCESNCEKCWTASLNKLERKVVVE